MERKTRTMRRNSQEGWAILGGALPSCQLLTSTSTNGGIRDLGAHKLFVVMCTWAPHGGGGELLGRVVVAVGPADPGVAAREGWSQEKGRRGKKGMVVGKPRLTPTSWPCGRLATSLSGQGNTPSTLAANSAGDEVVANFPGGRNDGRQKSIRDVQEGGSMFLVNNESSKRGKPDILRELW